MSNKPAESESFKEMTDVELRSLYAWYNQSINQSIFNFSYFKKNNFLT